MTRLRVGIIFGGRSGEHEVSLASAASVLQAIDRRRYEPVLLGITKDGRWLTGGDPLRALAEASGVKLALPPPSGAKAPVKIEGKREGRDGFPARLARRLHAVFPLVHGPFGEDGTLQGLLELADLPYVGAGVLASAVGMDKAMQKSVFRAAGLPAVEHLVVLGREWEREPEAVLARVATAVGFPCFVKPSNLGSSVGISKVKESRELEPALALAARYDRKLLVERAVSGREIEVAVLGNEAPEASLPGEILPGKEWYDYEAKYTPGLARFVIPAPLALKLTGELRRLAVAAFHAIDAAGMARVDFFLEGERILVNEINTIPGFTETSAYPRLWQATGLPFPSLIDRLIQLALERHHDKHRQ